MIASRNTTAQNEPSCARQSGRWAAGRAEGIPDASFMAGMLALKAGLYDEAVAHLERALQGGGRLGRHLRKYGVSAAVSLPTTPRIQAQIAPGTRGIRLALAEAHQARGAWEPAVEQLEQAIPRVTDRRAVIRTRAWNTRAVLPHRNARAPAAAGGPHAPRRGYNDGGTASHFDSQVPAEDLETQKPLGMEAR